MDANTFSKSWAALWLWMKALNRDLHGQALQIAYTYRKGQLDLHFTNGESVTKLVWKKGANSATLALYKNTSLPKKHVTVLNTLKPDDSISTVRINASDRLLQIAFQSGIHLVLGFYPAAANAYLVQGDKVIDHFFKKPGYPNIEGTWLESSDHLPELIPGSIDRATLSQASEGLSIDPEGTIHFGVGTNFEQIDITELDRSLSSNKSILPSDPLISTTKHGRTLLKRWKSKLQKMSAELEEANTWPIESQRLQGLQIALAMKLPINDDRIEIPVEFSPSAEGFQVTLKAGLDLNTEIQQSAKFIRKAKSKIELLTDVLTEVQNDIADLEKLIKEPSYEELQKYLISKGEVLDARGKQKTERTPYKKYLSPNGFDILVGRGSQDNDKLTFKIANKNDWWFHARQIRGSHVILRTGSKEPQLTDIRMAAEHAALNSKAKHAGIVVVQYCQRKHLSKPKGSPPGSVLVHHERSITVDLDLVSS